ncbi:MAG: YitT family protein [Eubacterium sp.]
MKDKLVNFFMLTLGTWIAASAVFFFMMPSHLAVASVSGLAVVLVKLVPVGLSVGSWTMVLNILCLFLAYFFVSKEFAAKTVYTSILLSLVIEFYEKVLPDYHGIMHESFLDLICYLFVVSFGLAILFVRNSSSGGLDVISMMLNKYFRIPLGTGMAVAGACVSVSSFFVYDAKTGVLSLLGTYLNGIILDHIIFGMKNRKKVCIVSTHVDEIKDFVLNELHSGASMYQQIGAYSNEVHPELEVIVERGEYNKLISFVTKIDPDAFVTIYNVGEVIYKPKVIESEPRRVGGTQGTQNMV